MELIFKRKVEKEFDEWMRGENVLLVTGLRQVGKTYFISYYLRSHYEHVIEINCLLNKGFSKDIQSAKDIEDFLFILSAYAGNVPFVPGKTAIFIDEIQSLQNFDIITLCKSFALDGRYKFVLSGSLLGISLNNVASWPVGYMTIVKMFPLDFEEFLWADGIDQNYFQKVKTYFEEGKALPDGVHNRLMTLFKRYLLIGGMPEPLAKYIQTNDIREVHQEKHNINALFKRDVHNYVSLDKRPHLDAIYDSIPGFLSKKDQRFKIGKITTHATRDKIADDFNWFNEAGIAIPVFNVTEPAVPLRMNEERTVLKLFFSDVGMLSYFFMNSETQSKLLNGDENINFGSIYENFVAQELTANGFENLFYYNSKKFGEVDFLLEYHGEILPIEVKSGNDFEKHKALDNLLQIKAYDLKKAIVFSSYNLKVDGNILYLPIYMVSFLKQGI